METTTQELIYQLLALIVSGILTIIGASLKKFITTKINIAKYGFENEKVERIIDNAVNFAELKGKDFAKDKAREITSKYKHSTALKYINEVDKSIIEKYGKNIDDMITRKVQQVIK